MKKPEISHETFELQIKLKCKLKSEKKFYWSPVGLKERSAESAKEWLNADFNVFKDQPNIQYRIYKVTYFKAAGTIVEEGNRESPIPRTSSTT